MPEAQRLFHIVTEILAIPVGIYLIYISTKLDNKFHKLAVFLIGLGNIIIDGYLLWRWFK